MATVRFFDETSPDSRGEEALHIGIAHDDTPGLERGQMREVVRAATTEDVELYSDAYTAYTDAGGTLTPQAPPEEAPTGPPANVDVPHVSGTGMVGDPLSCTMGIWTGMPTGYAYQWKSDGADVGTGSDTYVTLPGDLGHSITCVVTATNAFGSTAAPPSNAVVVSGLARGPEEPALQPPAPPTWGPPSG